MNLFIYEYITSGALLDEHLPDSLANEGNLMVSSVINDALQTDFCRITTLRDNRLSPLQLDNIDKLECHTVSTPSQYQQQWQYYLTHCDAILLIAPESKGCLITLQQQINSYPIHHLGSDLEATAITANKWYCYQHLKKHGIKTPNTIIARDWRHNLSKFNSDQWLTKPIDGAGCVDTFFWVNSNELSAHLDTVSNLEDIIIQPYIEGTPLSLSIHYSDKQTSLLSINKQKLTTNEKQLQLDACIVNDHSHSLSIHQAQQLAESVYKAIPGLNGFVGIDLIHNEQDNVIIDINPRITTSYCGLHQSLQHNPMAILFGIISAETRPSLPSLETAKTIPITL